MRCYFSESLSSYFTYVNTCKFTSIFRSKLKCGHLIVQRAEKLRLMSKTVVNFTTNGLKWGGSKFFFLFTQPTLDAFSTQWRRLVVSFASCHRCGLKPGCGPLLLPHFPDCQSQERWSRCNCVNLGCGPHLDHPPAPCSDVWCVCGQ